MPGRKLIAALVTVLFAVSAILIADARDFVLVLDPGHGGKDFGAIGKITNEKTINLKVTKRVGEKIKEKFDDVNVVYTRDDDSFVSLRDRASIANNAGGDLFISIHVNSVDKKNRNRRNIQGASVYTLGLHKSADNLEVAKRENSVMTLEDDYSSSYEGFNPESSESYIIFELSQNRNMEQSVKLASDIQQQLVSTAGRANKGVRQAGFWVLWSTSMPSVLVELDFICNPTQEKYLASKNGVEQLSDAIVNAFADYKSMRANMPIDLGAQTENFMVNRENDAAVKTDEEPFFMIEFLTGTRILSGSARELKGLSDVNYYQDKGLYHYVTGSFQTPDQANEQLGEIKALFPSAFIIKMQNGKRIK
ncbi:MAG: N-acetylmuramoyl-L-alanine amidase [Muribaculaceae bacterium]|nr:N-acetylmuramoyl-L-alanine amidase [Muribaculaceae bacterium]